MLEGFFFFGIQAKESWQVQECLLLQTKKIFTCVVKEDDL